MCFGTARGTRNAQSASQTVGVRFAADGTHAPASRIPAPGTVGTAVCAAPSAATDAVGATAAVRRGRVADVRAQTADGGRPVAEIQPLGRHSRVRRSTGRRPLAVHEPQQRGPVLDFRRTVSTGQ